MTRVKIGSSVRLVIDNERLRAQTLSELGELRRSRARIVVANDESRRILERDLHDGVQQRVIAAMYDLRLARAADASGVDSRLATDVDRLVAAAGRTLTELRSFAHGVFPAVLDQAGLVEALTSLADTAPVPVEIVADRERYPAEVERTAYLAVKAALDGASHAVSVVVLRHGNRAVVNVEGAGPVDVAPLDDRVGAMGGRLVVGEQRLWLELPCVSS